MNKPIATIGYYSALTAFFAASGYCVSQILQVVKWIAFPWDDILIYGFSLCIAIPFMLALLALHHTVPPQKKIWSHAALLLAILYAVYACFVYVVQLGAVLPKMIRGEADHIQVLVMAEHSFFWSLDALTYICMGLSTLFAAFAVSGNPSTKWLHIFFLANALLTPVVALVYFYPHFSIALLLLATPWCITVPGSMLLLARFFRRKLKHSPESIAYSSKVLVSH